jgi:peptide deformylase
MAVQPAELSVLRYPAPSLRMKARAVLKIDDHVKAVAARMIDLMHQHNGVGLAAPQVGLPWRMFVTDAPDDGGPKVYINPKLAVAGDEYGTAEEGCLSLPGIHVDIERPLAITMTAMDLDGKEIIVTSDAFPARVWQHEFDHLNGVLIIDRLSPKERQALRAQQRTSAALGGRVD